MKEDTTGILEQLSNRTLSKIKVEQLEELDPKEIKNFFILSESDLGVIRNGGRRGAAFGPKALINTLKKMSSHRSKVNGLKSIRNHLSCGPFIDQQSEDTNSISQLMGIVSNANIWHLGGGHDHIYPLLKAINTTDKKIIVINIDAHLDTRTDKEFHSGTPFRQFANEVDGDFKLFQLGIHDFANDQSNYEPIHQSEMEIYTVSQLRKETSNFTHETFIRLRSRGRRVFFCTFVTLLFYTRYFSFKKTRIKTSQNSPSLRTLRETLLLQKESLCILYCFIWNFFHWNMSRFFINNQPRVRNNLFKFISIRHRNPNISPPPLY